MNGVMLEHRANTSMICVGVVERICYILQTRLRNLEALRLLFHQTGHCMSDVVTIISLLTVILVLLVLMEIT